MTTTRYICVHGHFYQPPRENPWLEAIELQDSAQPYHDWNERIAVECYAPNAASRILGADGYIERIVNNYERISFNFGPTLLSWLESHDPETHAGIVEADRRSAERFSGHGSAMAQVYNHVIMPLAAPRDKATQVKWGIADFERRFGRRPEGMWLAETAVDLESLELLASHGIRFTVLSPLQASRTRPAGRSGWQDVRGARIDPARPYLCRLPGGGSIALFFYDGSISRAVAFEGLLNDGSNFARRLTGGFSPDRDDAQLVHIATDGESYGHHHRFGEMALSRAVEDLELGGRATLTNYGEFLERHPPRHEVEIFEASSWSCAHGVGRWSYDCGCNSGGHPGWNQAWRAPLRAAFNSLRDDTAAIFEREATNLLRDPWAARDDYIRVILDRGDESVSGFFARHARHDPDNVEQVKALKLLEMERNALLMFTSCGWFFDELSGIETVQNMMYAARCLQLGAELSQAGLEERFLGKLEAAKSNLPAFVNGAVIYERLVRPAVIDSRKVAANHAIRLVLGEAEPATRFPAHDVSTSEQCVRKLGEREFIAGRIRVRSTVTRESGNYVFGALSLGDHNIHAGIAALEDPASPAFLEEARSGACDAELENASGLLERRFPAPLYSLKSLFRDELRRAVNRLLEDPFRAAVAHMRELYSENAPLMRFLHGLDVPLPGVLAAMSQFVLNRDLLDAFEDEARSPGEIRAVYEEVHTWEFPVDAGNLAFAVKRALDAAAERLAANPADLAAIRRLEGLAAVGRDLPFQANFWKAQNIFYRIAKANHITMKTRARKGDEEALEWLKLYQSLGKLLQVRV